MFRDRKDPSANRPRSSRPSRDSPSRLTGPRPAVKWTAGRNQLGHGPNIVRPRWYRPPGLDPSELRFLSTVTRTPYVAALAGADVNRVAHYMLRWESTRGEAGPWSDTASASIGAESVDLE